MAMLPGNLPTDPGVSGLHPPSIDFVLGAVSAVYGNGGISDGTPRQGFPIVIGPVRGVIVAPQLRPPPGPG